MLCNGGSQTNMRSRLKRRLSLFTMSRKSAAPYEKMDDEKSRKVKKGKSNKENEPSCKEGKEKKKKKGWKRVRQAALTTCRYIGLGAAGLNPAAMYCAPDFSMDPKQWNQSFNPSSKHSGAKVQTQAFTSAVMFAGWC